MNKETFEASRSTTALGILAASAAVLLWIGLGAPILAAPAASDAASDLAKAWTAYDEAKEFDAGLAALETVNKTASAYPKDWLVQLWTAYVHTQMGRWATMEKREGAAAYLDSAQAHLDKALTLEGADSDEARSSLHALQSLIYGFRDWFGTDTAEGGESPHKTMEAEAIQKAIRAGPENPAVEIFVATHLITEAGKEKDLGKVIAAKALLEKAKASIGGAAEDRTSTPYWNVDWLGYWSSQADDILTSVKKKEMEEGG